MSTDDLLTYLFDGKPHPLSPQVAAWLATSRRFATFTTAFRTKIRKKLHATREQEGLDDLRLELETTYLPPQGQGGRCPDFAVTFTTHAVFMLEVTWQRPLPEDPPTPERAAERLGSAVCGKLGQLLPQHSNVLVIGLGAPCSVPDLHALMHRVQYRAERNDPGVVQRHRFRDPADFFRHYGRLSEVLVCGPQGGQVVGWSNPQAKRPLPARARTTLLGSHTARGA